MNAITTPPRQNILVVEVDAETYKDIAAVLQRISFDVDWLPTATGALELVTLVPFKALILNYPLATVPLEQFLARARASDSASRKASVALLAIDAAAARAHVDGSLGVDLVLADDASPSVRQHQLCSLLGIPPRASVRMLVRLEVSLVDSRRERFLAQTNDLSTSGMFVTTNRTYPVGSRARAELNLPGDSSPFVGDVEVARHSDSARDPVQGMGLRFLGFADGKPTRLERYLESLSP